MDPSLTLSYLMRDMTHHFAGTITDLNEIEGTTWQLNPLVGTS